MAIVAFSGTTMTAGAFGFGQSISRANIVVSTGDWAAGTGQMFVGKVSSTGDPVTTLEVDELDVGTCRCNTARGGHQIGADAEGRTIPHSLTGKYIDISVDCGGLLPRRNQLTTVEFKVTERREDGNRGSVLYHWNNGQMRMYSYANSHDFAISGIAREIQNEARRRRIETKVFFNMTDEEVEEELEASSRLRAAGRR